jgi:hypothetical protein
MARSPGSSASPPLLAGRGGGGLGWSGAAVVCFPSWSAVVAGGEGGAWQRRVWLLRAGVVLRLLDLLVCFLWINGRARIWSCLGGCVGLRRLLDLFSDGMGQPVSVPRGRTVWV